MQRRHPSPLELGAYFDGEPIEGVPEHVARCRKCRESLDELRGVRCAVRGELDLTDGSARRRARWTVALLPVAAAVALLLAMAAPPGGLPVTRVENADQSAFAPAAPPQFEPTDVTEVTADPLPPVDPGTTPSRPRAADRAGSAVASKGGSATAEAPVPESGLPTVPAAGPANVKPAAGRPAAVPGSGPGSGRSVPAPTGALRLGVPVPVRGPASGEGAEVLRAVRAVAERANDAGGVAGRRVEVVIVPTDDGEARSKALGRVEALVGGFAVDAPAGMPWVMPADIAPVGPDVAAGELAAEQAGAALGLELAARRSEPGTVGAIVGSGPDAGLVAGLSKSLPVQQVSVGPGTSCDQEVVALRKRDVTALALAVPPDVARRCAASAARMGWRPSGGLLLAPSAVYAHLERDLATQGALSAVALSASNNNDAGTARFRRSCPGCDSHRSLMSFAAAELALGSARTANGALTMSGLRDRRWQSDLYDINGGQHTTSHVVSIRFGRWSNVTPSRDSSPGMRRSVLNPVGNLLTPEPDESLH
jgi:hypothetical protein